MSPRNITSMMRLNLKLLSENLFAPIQIFAGLTKASVLGLHPVLAQLPAINSSK